VVGKDIALFLYGFDITGANQFLDFKTGPSAPIKTAVLRVGNYTLTGLCAELKRAMQVADNAHIYTWGATRTYGGGTQNRVSVASTATALYLLGATGPNAANSVMSPIGFLPSDYSGNTGYTGANSAGIALIPEFPTWSYTSPDQFITNDGSKNVSAAGIKETLVFSQMLFLEGQWKYITNYGGRTQQTEWQNFLKYATRQLKFEFSPSIYEDPSVYYQVTIESTGGDSNGMGYKLTQMVGLGLYRFWDTGIIKMRVIPFNVT
jgi:hypothetical protein